MWNWVNFTAWNANYEYYACSQASYLKLSPVEFPDSLWIAWWSHGGLLCVSWYPNIVRYLANEAGTMYIVCTGRKMTSSVYNWITAPAADTCRRCNACAPCFHLLTWVKNNVLHTTSRYYVVLLGNIMEAHTKTASLCACIVLVVGILYNKIDPNPLYPS